MPIYDDKDYEDLDELYAAQGAPFPLVQQPAPAPQPMGRKPNDASEEIMQAILSRQNPDMPSLKDLREAQKARREDQMWTGIGKAGSGIGYAIAKVPRPQSDIQDWNDLKAGADQRVNDIIQQRDAGLKESLQDIQRQRIRDAILQRQSEQQQKKDLFQQGLQSQEQRAREALDTKMQLGQQHNELMAGLKSMTESDKKSRQNDQNVAQLSERLNKNGLDELDSVIANIKGNINLNSKDDIPGVGQTGWAPDVLVTDKGKEVRQAISSLQNILLKARSGGAVTPQEAQRYLNELGYGSTKNDAQLRTGIKNTIGFLASKHRNILAGYDQGVKDTYLSRGGKFPDFSTDSAPSPEPTSGWTNEKEKRYQELKAKSATPR